MSWILDVIHDFSDSWSLLGASWVAGWCIAVALALPGILVVARDQMFIGAAIAQASTCGVAIGLWIAGIMAQVGGPMSPAAAQQSNGALRAVPVTAAVIAAVIAALATTGTGRDRRSSPESRTAWIYLAGAAGTMLLLINSPHGTRGVERLMSSSLLGADPVEAWLCAVLAVGGIILTAWRGRTLALLAIDPSFAALAGLRREWWERGLAIWVGLGVGVAIRVGGLLFAFGCLVLPALIARGVCREVRSQLLVAPLVALVVAVIGFAVANHHNLFPAQLTVALLCVGAPVAGLVGRLRR